MAELRNVPYPRFLEPAPGEVASHLSMAGIERELAARLGEALTELLRRMADEYETNTEQSADVVRIEATAVEDHDHDGSGSTQVDHGNLLGLGDSDHDQYHHRALSQALLLRGS